ncbi:endolytic transglycosylase MltG [Stackebrandtia soli]|uniref:endolytic transglycosylase MltG n=1 Tax=Stackebrandtia soli TaxID=1892856 RepID=UPI0039E8C73A
MLDELPFETDDAALPRSHRRKRGGRSALTLTLVVVLLGGLAVGGWWGFDKVKGFFGPEDYDGTGNGEFVAVEVAEGDLLDDIGVTLVDAGVVKSVRAFTEAAAENPASTGIQPGVYRLQKEMSGEAALNAMLDPSSKGFPPFTLADGYEYWTAYESLAQSTGIPVEEFEEAGKDPAALGVPDVWFERLDGRDIAGTVEGFLLPQEYQFAGGATAESILTEMVTAFLAYAEEVDFVDRAQELGYSPYEVLVVASLADAEAGTVDDLAKVARVAYNRLTHPEYYCRAEGVTNCLEFDSSTNYGLMLAGGEKKDSNAVTWDELSDADNEYSTHIHSGLPPGPINSPGKAAIEGALNPPTGTWLFFVAIDKEGNSEFASTLDEHNANVAEACSNGVLTVGC